MRQCVRVPALLRRQRASHVSRVALPCFEVYFVTNRVPMQVLQCKQRICGSVRSTGVVELGMFALREFSRDEWLPIARQKHRTKASTINVTEITAS
jgi:hypothetical protein